MIDTAILLAAGQGSRLRGVAASKPLCPVAGRPLIDHALSGLAKAGMRRAIVVVGYRGADIRAHLASRAWPLEVMTVMTDYRQPNGVSALAARALVGAEGAVMAMCDHLV
ncbi:MAG TPA: NTP transferase domain-containing protein, partial [Sphingomonas sp.]